MLEDRYIYAVNYPPWDEILKKLGLTIPAGRSTTAENKYMKCFLHIPKEETASLCFIEKKCLWFCFGCHQSGDKFHFVSAFLTGQIGSYKRTARWFEKKFGIPSPYRRKKRNEEKTSLQRKETL